MTPKLLRSQVLNIGKNIAGHKRLGGKSVQGDYMESTDCEKQAERDKNLRNWSNNCTKSNFADFMNFFHF